MSRVFLAGEAFSVKTITGSFKGIGTLHVPSPVAKAIRD